MVQVRNNQMLAIKLDQSLRHCYTLISEIVLNFAAGNVRAGQQRKVVEMDLSILSISFIAQLKLGGLQHIETAGLLEYIIQLAKAEPGRDNLKELAHCYGLLKSLEERVFTELKSLNVQL